MIKKVKFAELHSPLFFGGKNHGLKLFSKAGVELEYDTEEKELLVKWNGGISHLPSTSVHCYEPGVLPKVVSEPAPPAPTRKIKAQVSGPQEHVFAGEGHGVVRDKR